VVARRERFVIALLVRLARVMRLHLLTDVTVAARKKSNALAFQSGVTRAALLDRSATLTLLTWVGRVNVNFSAELGVASRVHPNGLASKTRVARATFLNRSATLVFSTRVLSVVNAGPGSVGVMPRHAAVKPVVARVSIARLAETTGPWRSCAELGSGAAETVLVVEGVASEVVVEGIASEVVVEGVASDVVVFSLTEERWLAGAFGNLERGVSDSVLPICDGPQAQITRIRSASAALALTAAVA